MPYGDIDMGQYLLQVMACYLTAFCAKMMIFQWAFAERCASLYTSNGMKCLQNLPILTYWPLRDFSEILYSNFRANFSD